VEYQIRDREVLDLAMPSRCQENTKSKNALRRRMVEFSNTKAVKYLCSNYTYIKHYIGSVHHIIMIQSSIETNPTFFSVFFVVLF